MIRDSLMLSDTAMLLLRRYIQVQEDSAETQSRSSNVFSPVEPSHWTLFFDQHVQSADIAEELFSELWYLWASPDLEAVRHLESHFIIDGDLMTQMEQVFTETAITVRDRRVPIYQPHRMVDFVKSLVQTLAKQKEGVL